MIEITTLGSFSIKVDGETVSESFKKTTRLLQLLNLLIVNRNKPLSTGFICDAIWHYDDEGNTYRALHNLIYRLRNIFACESGQDCIVFNNKTYMLNATPDLQIDVYLIEDYYNKALDPKITADEKIELLKKIVDLYNGEYMLYLTYDDVSSYSAANRYKRIFSDAVCMLSDMYIENGEYDKMFQICDKAIALDPLEESVYLRVVKGMRMVGRDVRAIGLIENYFDILYRATGIRASDTLNNIYKELKGYTELSKSDVEEILDELNEISTSNRAVFCNFSAFKDIYRYEARHQGRRDYAIILILIEICGSRDEELSEKTLSKAKRNLHECCMMTLRKGDIFSDYSKSQVMVMLTMAKGVDAEAVTSRINNQFQSYDMDYKAFLRFDMQSAL